MSAPLERPPLSDVVDTEVDERRIRRVWRSVEPQVLTPRRRGGRPALRVAAGVLVALGVALAMRRSPEAPARSLALEDGGAPTAMVAGAPVVFAEGSRIELDRGTEIVPTRNDAHDFGLSLTHGAAHFAVTPGGPRRWRIDCGLAVVEVIGTAFRIERSDDGVHVTVEHGHVRMTATDGRSWDLHAGEEMSVAPLVLPVLATAPEVIIPIAAPTEEVPATEAALAPSTAAVVEPAEGMHWTELAQSGAYDRAYAAARDEEVDSSSAAPSELLLLADVARLSGHPAEAVVALERLITDNPAAPEASLAAVLLGRVQQDALHAPSAAARAFERAETLGVPASLRADVEGRLALAYLALGDPRGEGRARRYLIDHPDGAHAEALAAQE